MKGDRENALCNGKQDESEMGDGGRPSDLDRRMAERQSEAKVQREGGRGMCALHKAGSGPL